MLFHCYRNLSILIEWEKVTVKGVVSRNSVKLGNYKMPIKVSVKENEVPTEKNSSRASIFATKASYISN